MFSIENSTLSIAIKQYRYKLKAVSFISLIFLQLFIVILSSSGGSSGMYSSGMHNISISVKNYSSDIVFFGTFIWIIVMGFTYTMKVAKNMDFTLITNRFSSCLSDMGLLFTLSIIGGATASLSGMLIRVVFYFTSDTSFIMESAFTVPYTVLFTGMAANILYLFLISGVAYLFGMIVEIHKVFIIAVPTLVFSLSTKQSDTMMKIVDMFIRETSLLAFSGKVFLMTALLYALSMLIYHRREVSR